MIARIAGLFLLCCTLAVTGCVRGPLSIPYTLGEKDGAATMTVGKLTLIFEGVELPESYKGSTGSISIAVPGRSGNSKNSFAGLTIKQEWGDGVTRIWVNDREFKLIEKGTELEFADKTYPVNDKEMTIVVLKNSKTKVK